MGSGLSRGSDQEPRYLPVGDGFTGTLEANLQTLEAKESDHELSIQQEEEGDHELGVDPGIVTISSWL